MKLPTDIAARLTKQWHQSSLRVDRLLSADAWPIDLSIGKPSAQVFINKASQLQHHIEQWRAVTIGHVIWEDIKYRAGLEAISIPVQWRISSPSEWVAASSEKQVCDEFETLESIVSHARQYYHEFFVRERHLWRNKSVADIIMAAKLADTLLPGAAKGRPLRLLSGHNIDTKFFERHAYLLTRLLDERYEGAVSEQGLHTFLDAYNENDHWVLIVPLDDGLLPYRRQRITTKELAEVQLSATHIVVVENEQCLHHLPHLENTVAILGAGLDLSWLQSDIFHDKQIAYWGDMDTWGLQMLARSRHYCSSITPLFMNKNAFDKYSRNNTVIEATPANLVSPSELTVDEAQFYHYLLGSELGRLEQEYLLIDDVKKVLKKWRKDYS